MNLPWESHSKSGILPSMRGVTPRRRVELTRSFNRAALPVRCSDDKSTKAQRPRSFPPPTSCQRRVFAERTDVKPAEMLVDDRTLREPCRSGFPGVNQNPSVAPSRRASSLSRRSIGLSPRDILPSVSQRATMVPSAADMKTVYVLKMQKPFSLTEKSAE